MSYFSRLTDIVTCNLSELLAEAENPTAALEQIIDEMRAGVEAAQRSVSNAAATEQRIRAEIEELSRQLTYWGDVARQELKVGREDKARLALMRKQEVDDLVAGVTQQRDSAESTRKHLETTLRALEARLADAIRRRSSLLGNEAAVEPTAPAFLSSHVPSRAWRDETRERQIEDELAAMKRELDTGNGRESDPPH
jgi:phage shock protein A